LIKIYGGHVLFSIEGRPAPYWTTLTAYENSQWDSKGDSAAIFTEKMNSVNVSGEAILGIENACDTFGAVGARPGSRYA